jgi:eukaryotic-like serine/threonine-protein kinase
MLAELQAADPRSVGPYRLLGRLGSGGMGRVYLGRSPAGRLVAVKVIRPDLAGEPGFGVRFAREVTAARNVSGLFTALVVDADVSGPVPWLATVYVPGPSLSEAVASQGPLPTAAVLTLASGLAQGLQAIHAAGVVHRDLKPANVLLARDGPRVIDFGISRAAEATETTTALTQTGMVLGSPGFMSPEQAEGAAVGPPSDVFSLGAVLTFAGTGEGPFGTGSTPQLLYRVVHSPPDLARLPREIRSLVERCLVKDPGLRPTTSDLLAALGAGRPAADWLSTALPLYPPVPADGDTPVPADSVSDTPVPAHRLSYAPVPAGSRAAAESTPLEQLFALPQPGDAAGRRRRRDRRRLTLATAAAAAVLAAASASAALTLASAGGAHRSSTDSSQHSTVPSAPSPRAAGAASPRASRTPVGSGPTQQAVSQVSTTSPPASSPTTGSPTPSTPTPTPTPSTPTPTPSTPTPTPSTPTPTPSTPTPSTPTPSPSGPTPSTGTPITGAASATMSR